MPRILYSGPPDLAEALRTLKPMDFSNDSADTDGALLAVPVESCDADTLERLAQSLLSRETSRLSDRDPGGWPAWIVLTDCDRLLERGDRVGDWLDRIESRRFSIEHTVRSHLTGFGRIEPMVTSVSLRSPAMAGSPVDATGGFGIVSLAEQIAERTDRHHRTAARSNRRLIASVTTAIAAFLILLASTGAAIRWAGPLTDDRLTALVRSYQVREKPTAIRLSDARRPRIRAELKSLREDVAYSILDPELKAFVEQRWNELERYERYTARFRPPQLSAGECRSIEELDQLVADLRSRLAPPADDADAWAETEAMRLRRKWAAEVDALRAAEGTLHTWFSDQVQRIHRLILTPTFDQDWQANVRSALDESESPPLKADQTLPGSDEVPVPGGEKLGIATAYEFDRVETARRELDASRDRLNRLRDVVSLLGLTAETDDAVLNMTGPATAVERLSDLERRSPAILETPDAYAVPNWGDPNRDLIRQRIARSRERLTLTTRERIRLTILKLGNDRETQDAWSTWAASITAEDRAAGRLLALLMALETGQGGTDPVQELRTFVSTESWPVTIDSIEIIAPDAMTAFTPKRLRLTVGESVAEWTVTGTPKAERGLRIHRLDRIGPRIEFKAGQPLSAKLSCEGSTTVLEWDQRHSAVFPFDLFAAEPMRLDPGKTPERAVGINVRIVPNGTWPTLPSLMPDFRTTR